ncbi:hypothetical protein B0A54_09464 [Friedmanniomyces endolithicus]|uniref:Vta1/callose synthase N-terminal domain-containing protein n=1 Tax=Friedmanniomyces endolithicus TaxID=329885 RepID=A0A4V5N772_9PEZI|nr:hypothetical protein LTS09_005313 [Friedmanniomyces endolithicus]KAK0309414.1 hypothetical protein LTR01_004521 [Friedmanniomyces endolithicus]KAK0833165.1 hypothetical protein LTR73_002253 [Friedmanniomyces endolithicus]TKA38529.1 hypothetical protein B0A54_09464 [Friedmanniomyces endolithicus]
MAVDLPAKLKTAGIQPFANRATQLEKYRPIVWYWCEYYILQQILSKQLHLGDDEVQNYAVRLMDTLETFKTSNSANDAITDDLAAKAYIENFATETFNRGDETQRTNKVTRQTADTFQAAATFIDLMTIWGQLDGEMAVKSRYAKYHAVRIAKAIKAGEDPNATNPVVEEPQGEDNVDAELQALEQQAHNGGISAHSYRPPTVEDAPPSALPSRPASGGRGHLHSRTVQTMSESDQIASLSDNMPDVSPIEQVDRHGSLGGGYFPSVPGVASNDILMSDDPPIILPQPPTQQDGSPASEYYSSHANSTPTPGAGPPQHPSIPFQQPSTQTPSTYYAPPPTLNAVNPPPHSSPCAQPTPRATYASAPPPPPVSQGPPLGGYKTDDESVLAAQKHAKWAISALNFEDVDTAVKEFRIALRALGAS